MRASRPFSHAVLAGVLVASVGLSACGRKGPLEPPPGAVTDTPGPGQAAGAQATGAEGGPSQAAPTAAPGTTPPGAEPPRSFFLDFLL
jgi:predicted small lipoprotein YifL